ncbi:protein FAM187B [Dendropsophus ebraccatus]|uniref:protein FAM187B n=1 Tax=Dendropsophus ebraccatus TaxID=150705 RepID=UPI003831E53E
MSTVVEKLLPESIIYILVPGHDGRPLVQPRRQPPIRSMIRASISLYLGILVYQTLAESEGSITLSCPAHRPCTVALASHNPITLRCEGRPDNAHVSWQYRDLWQPHARPVTFIQSSGPNLLGEDLDGQEQLKVLDLVSRSEIPSGNLRLLSPRVQDSGIYTCRDGGNLLAYYEIDFQDSENIYISHAGLGHRVRPNASIDLGVAGTAEVFTVWQDWQSCDRCGMPGERKKLGFCYYKITRSSEEEPRPCGLLQSSPIQLNGTPELRMETCMGGCGDVTSMEDVTVLLDNYHTNLHADVLFTCPDSSIYKPVYWEHGNTSFTYLQQMMNNTWYVLDKTTAGGTLFIPILNKSDEGIYRCYVDHRLVGQFHVIFPNIKSTTSAPQGYTTQEAIMIGLFIVLGILFVLRVLQSYHASDSAQN